MSRVKEQLEKSVALIDKTVREIDWAQQEVYTNWLRNSYEYAFNSTRILALAAGNFPGHQTHLSNRFVKHAAEETGHEKLLERDLKHFDLTPEKIQPSMEAKFFHQSLYRWLGHQESPMALFGWVLVLEATAVYCAEYLQETCEKAFGKKSATFLKVHAGEDPDHLDKALAAIKNLDEEDMNSVIEAMEQYTFGYVELLNSCHKYVDKENLAVA